VSDDRQTFDIPTVTPEAVAHAGTHFAWLRTRMSMERTLMSWVRTAAALIGFGFTIFTFFEQINQSNLLRRPVSIATPRIVSLALIGLGTLALLIAEREYRQLASYLRSPDFSKVAGVAFARVWTPARSIAVALAAVGAMVFFTLLLRSIW
jgi:putative membrane protein